MKKRLFYLVYLFSIILLFFGGVELYLSYLLNQPESCPEKWTEKMEVYYNENERSIIQYEPNMAQYDSGLFYILKPGEFIFSNSEFSTKFNVNSLGCRDDEGDIKTPKIVMVGDSYGMGWGVEQNEVYADLVEKRLKENVLNMGVSSYGTPREMKFLERINTDSLEYLVIQHCPNDYGEIVQYLWNENELKVSSEHIYDSISNLARINKPYYLFKRTKEFLPIILGRSKKESTAETIYPEVPDFNIHKGFLNILRNAKNIPKHTKIIVFTLGVKGYKNNFMESVEKMLNKEFGSTMHDRITFLNFSKVLKPENYFKLDAHMNASGHRVVADTLIKYISAKPKGVYEKKWDYDNGRICIKASYLNQIKQGPTTYYWPNGNKSQETHYTRGEKDGIEVRFNENGEEISRKSYKMGVEL